MEIESNHIYQGDCLDVMRRWPDAFIHCCVTSPPYWGLRDYKSDGQIGLEKTPEEYVTRMVDVFREVRRVLRADGTLWLNMGDSYAGSGKGSNPDGTPHPSTLSSKSGTNRGCISGVHLPQRASAIGLKPKDLVGIPWILAFALQADGWYLRSDIIWAKPNPMPESVLDRPTKAHEYMFLMAKSKTYYYDAEAIREPAIYRMDERPFGDAGGNRHGDELRVYKPPYQTGKHGKDTATQYKTLPEGQSRIRIVRDKQRGHGRRHEGFNDRWDQMNKQEQCSAMRNKRDVWTVATSPFSQAHFATFPPELIKPCILAGSMGGA